MVCSWASTGCHRLEQVRNQIVNGSLGFDKDAGPVATTAQGIGTVSLRSSHPDTQNGPRPSDQRMAMRELNDVRRSSARTIRDVESSPPRPPRMLVTAHPNPELSFATDALPPEFVEMLKTSIAAHGARTVEETSAIRIAPEEELYPSEVVPASATAVSRQSSDPESPSPQCDPTTVDPTSMSAIAPQPSTSSEPTERRTLSDASEEPAQSPSQSRQIARATPPAIQEIETAALRAESNPIDQAIRELEQRLQSGQFSDSPTRIKQEMELRLLRLVAGRVNDALEPVEGISEHEQAYLQCQLRTLQQAVSIDMSRSDSRRWLPILKDHREAESHLAAVSGLEVRDLAFCSEVLGYGNYKRLPTQRFRPDQELLIYCELDNVVSKLAQEGYQTTLKGSYEIIDKDGVRIIEQALPAESETSKNQRRDVFIVYRIYMPSQIAPGKYQLRLTMEDGVAGKFGTGFVDFQIIK